MDSVISIVGATATGKTALALDLAQHFLSEKKVERVDLISVDSRQVYRELSITSGADVPDDFALFETSDFSYPVFKHINLPIFLHGVSIISVTDEWSLSHFQQFAQEVVEKSQSQNGLSILVGGTGLYHRWWQVSEPAIQVPPNQELRQDIEQLAVPELQQLLQQQAPQVWEQLNNSDRYNPVRLVRKLELAEAGVIDESLDNEHTRENSQPVIGLYLPDEAQQRAIQDRVTKRWNASLIEVREVLENKDAREQALRTLGVPHIKQFLANELTADEAQQLWAQHEWQYAKRQRTWWKQNKNVNWFDVSARSWQDSLFTWLQKNVY